MTETTVHPYPPKDSFDGGDLDCGNGLLLLIRKHIDPLSPGELLEIVSRDSTVEVDLPSWCNLTKNELINVHTEPGLWRFLVSKGPFTPPADAPAPITDVATTNVDPDIALQPQKLKKKRKKPQMAITQE
ncbi:MAG: sulfurtransferase TusA family protein, partial [Yaniella sp.]|nr:sulfurtransferase TusA family protein [Yaniella sp.]